MEEKSRDQRTLRGPIPASERMRPRASQVKADRVYSADWSPVFFLKEGYPERFSKKLTKASWRCLRACWGGTEEISRSQAWSGVRLSLVRSALVSL